MSHIHVHFLTLSTITHTLSTWTCYLADVVKLISERSVDNNSTCATSALALHGV